MKSGYQLAQQDKANKDKPFDWAIREFQKKAEKLKNEGRVEYENRFK